MKSITRMLVPVMICTLVLIMTSCGKESIDYANLRDVSWEGTELTITLGENKSTGCQWTTKPEDDKVIDYSTNRVFHLADSEVLKGDAIGSLEAGFKGKGSGTTRIICTTPVGWDGSGEGFCYIVTVTVNEDGTIESAKGEESAAAPAAETKEMEASTTAEAAEMTLEDYFSENAAELEQMRKNLKEDESYKDVVDIDLDVKGNTLSYIYTFKEIYTDEQISEIKPDLKKSMEGDEMKNYLKEQITSIEEGYGVKGVKMYMEYRNGDGSKIIDDTYE